MTGEDLRLARLARWQRKEEQVATIQQFLAGLDEQHRNYARGYAEELSLGEPAPSAAGLDGETVREIRRRVWKEWQRRIEAMPGRRSA